MSDSSGRLFRAYTDAHLEAALNQSPDNVDILRECTQRWVEEVFDTNELPPLRIPALEDDKHVR